MHVVEVPCIGGLYSGGVSIGATIDEPPEQEFNINPKTHKNKFLFILSSPIIN